MWSSTANVDYMSLTAHFLTEDMKQIHICCDMVPFPYESHTATNLVNFMNESLERWGLLEKLNVVVRDNLRNIVSAMEVWKFTNIPCLAHTLQLVVKDGCLDNERISLLTATCRRIAGHFKHLVKSYKLLRQSQEILGLHKHSIIQDEPTRYPYCSSLKVTTSEVIPIINAVNMSIDRIKDYGNFKESLCQSLHRCYGDCENEPIYAFATIIDPRFKNKIFRSRTMAEKAVTLLIGELNALDIDEGHEIKAAENQEPTTPAPGAIWSLYNQLIITNSVIYTAHFTMSDKVAVYLKEPLLASHEDVFEYWRKSKFLNMKKLAQKYLGMPLCTVFSERLFSTAVLICNRKRGRLTPERVQMLVFLNKNLPFLNYQY
ncbi:zinc finger BED domain-containing protein 4-like [Hydra vulgaris]|uniref:Zinc finger BED domain-containing protein 4-like n=1 Tax=Hydra vulgaris TaxID=6087 RepID=A0ABM4C3N8_HYDVU